MNRKITLALMMGLVMTLQILAVTDIGTTRAEEPDHHEAMGPEPLPGSMPEGGDDTSSRNVIRNWNIQVAFEFGPTKHKLWDVIDGLKWGNKVLYDATEGQFRWRHAEIWTHGEKFNDPDTDIQILDTGPNYRANAYRGGIDYNGGVIHLGKTMFGKKWNSTWGAMTMAHEWGHYGLYLPDEYVDVDMGDYIVSVPWCNNSLMANSSDMDRDTEFCTLDNHNYSNPNAEPAGSCWEQIEDHYPTVDMPQSVNDLDQDGPTYPASEEMTFDINYPDLFIEESDITMSPADPMPGDDVSITAKIHNKYGMLYGDVVVVRVYDGPLADGDLIGEKSISLSGSEYDEISVDWIAEGGPHDITVQIDPNDQVVEWVEYANNTVARTFDIPAYPVIDQGLGDLEVEEDEVISLELKPFESDIESPDEDLLWTVTDHDDTAISEIEGEESPDDIINITPVENYFGTTDITLTLTDGDGLTDSRSINLTWTEVNDAPEVGTISLQRDWVHRTTGVHVYIDGSDAEEPAGNLEAELQYKHQNDTQWNDLDPAFDGTYFDSILTPVAEAELGPYDLRARLYDSGFQAGNYEYLNSTLNVLNSPAIIDDYSLGDEVAYRGQPLNISLDGHDDEDDGEDLYVEVMYRPFSADDWRDGGNFDSQTANYDDGTWLVPFIAPIDAPREDCDLRIRLVDKDGPGIWLYINDTVTIDNSVPFVTAFTSEEEQVYRTDTVALEVKGHDMEDPIEELDLSIEYSVDRKGMWKDIDPRDLEIELMEAGTSWEVLYTPPDDAEVGGYHLRVTLTDGEHGDSIPFDMEYIVEVLNNLPMVEIDCKKNLQAGILAIFDGRSSEDIEDGEELDYQWTFGDGSKSSKARAKHTFQDGGRYTVGLTVTDQDGDTNTSEVEVFVSGGSMGGSSGGSPLFMAAIGAGIIIAVVVVVVLLMWKKGMGPF